MSRNWDVIIVGAGPAGLGCARALQCAGVKRVLVIERSCVGSTFQDWADEMRFITPSFNTNSFDHPDLNSICPSTSPADMYGTEHLSGKQYAGYLLAFALHFDIEVREHTAVTKIVPNHSSFEVVTHDTTLEATFVIWAAGEYLLPKPGNIKNSHLGRHTSLVKHWRKIKGRDFIVVGGYESGIDAAYHLIGNGGRVRLLSESAPWSVQDADPSNALSPYTKERLGMLQRHFHGRLTLLPEHQVLRLKKSGRYYTVITNKGEFQTPNPPFLVTGFESSLTPIGELFEWEQSTPKFNSNDESTLHPGLFYSGPSLVHEGSKFCFIYKFRARFGVIAKAISDRLIGETNGLELYRQRGFLMEDLSCCLDCRCELDSKNAL